MCYIRNFGEMTITSRFYPSKFCQRKKKKAVGMLSAPCSKHKIKGFAFSYLCLGITIICFLQRLEGAYALAS